MIAVVMQAALILFMVGTLLAMGLGLTFRQAAAGLARRDVLFRALLLGFVAGPAFAFLLGHALSLAPEHQRGLLLLSLSPCAPFLPAVAARSGGNAEVVAAIMLVLAAATVVLLPFAVPVIMPGVEVAAIAVAQPMVALVLAPMIAGMALRHWAPRLAERLRQPIARLAQISGIALLALCLYRYGADFLNLYGTFAILALVLFLAGMTAMAALAGRGLAASDRVALTLAMTTRNVGAAFAPLLAAGQTSGGASLLIVLAVPIQIVAAEIAGRRLAAQRPPPQPATQDP